MNILGSLLGGIITIVLVFILLYRFSPLGGKQSAIAVAMAVLFIYIPYSILSWPGGDVFAMHIALYMVSAYLLGIISSYREKRIAEQGGDSGRWFHWGPTTIVIFFMTFISLDALFVSMATQGLGGDVASWLLPKPKTRDSVQSYFPGTVEHDYQKVQSQYNEYLHQLEVQKARGWQVHKGWLTAPVVGQATVFQLEARDKQGKPLNDLRVEGRFLRPSNSKQDQAFTMTAIGEGRYQVKITLPYPGHWDLHMKLYWGDQIHKIQASTQVENG